MKAVLVFNTVNELIYWNWDESFLQQIGKLNGNADGEVIDEHIVAQLLSPMVTSQCVMAAQFGNTYSSITCFDNMKIVFTEWLEQLMMCIGTADESDLKRELNDCRLYAQHLCLNNADLLRKDWCRIWLTAMLKARSEGDGWAATGATACGSSDVGGRALLALREAFSTLKLTNKHYHLALIKNADLIALYSTRGSADLMPADIAMLSVHCVAARDIHDEYVQKETVSLFERSSQVNSEDNFADDETELATEASDDDGFAVVKKEENYEKSSWYLQLPWLDKCGSCVVNMCMEDTNDPSAVPCAPHRLRMLPLAHEIMLVILEDLGRRETGLKLWKAAAAAAESGNDGVNSSGGGQEVLRITVNKATEALRRAKFVESANALGSAITSAFAQGNSSQQSVQLSALKVALVKAAKQLMTLPPSSFSEVVPLRELLASNTDLAKIMQSDGTWQARELVEEFPGLIHFVFFNRKTGRVTAPRPPPPLTQVMVWDILRRGWRCARNATGTAGTANKGGWSAAAWRQGGLHACWVRWRSPNLAELLVIHLGLVPADIALGAARRLANALDDLAHPAHHPAHLL